jgi:alpha-1,6-mannosyltransferase
MTAAAHERTRFYQLCALAVLLVALTMMTPLALKVWGDNGYMALTVPAGLVALAATYVAERGPVVRSLWLIVIVAVGLRVVLVALDPLLSGDLYRYVWDGRVQAAGINPYRYIPADPALTPLRDAAIYPNINRFDYAVTIYPPVAQMFFFVVTRIGESVTVMRLAFLGCEIVTVVVIWLLLQQLGQPVTRLVAYLWHPLPMWEIANSGHIDALMVALMMTGLWLLIKGKALRGVAAIALAALAKPFAVLALPACWRPWDWRAPVLAVAIVAACYAPYLAVGFGVIGFLPGYVSEERIDDGGDNWPLNIVRLVIGAHPGDAVVYFALVGVVVGGLALAVAFRSNRTPDIVLGDTAMLLLVFLLLLSPKYPWYFLAIMPFVALRGGALLWAASIGAPLLQEEVDWGTYIPLFVRQTGLYGGIAMALLWTIWNRRRVAADRGVTGHGVAS